MNPCSTAPCAVNIHPVPPSNPSWAWPGWNRELPAGIPLPTVQASIVCRATVVNTVTGSAGDTALSICILRLCNPVMCISTTLPSHWASTVSMTTCSISDLEEPPALISRENYPARRRNQPWFPGETVITGIGQGFFLVTPLQLANATAALATNGLLMKPQIVHAEQEANRDELQPHHPELTETITVNNQDHWDAVIEAMIDVVHSPRGTARRIGADSPYRIAGKTGTAQVFGLKQDEEYDAETLEKKLRDHALFIAFAPADDPQIAVAVIVENGGSGGSVAAPIARTIMDTYLQRTSP